MSTEDEASRLMLTDSEAHVTAYLKPTLMKKSTENLWSAILMIPQ